jgi:thiosulfate/3-mercaptopyruvate sulfurtransferase
MNPGLIKPLIPVEEVFAIDGNALVLVDASSGPDSFANYQAGHLRLAIFGNADESLARKTNDPSVGGRHPLPAIGDFAVYLGKLGIRPDSHVVIYDHKQGANMAARLWWMLKAVGHRKVQVLDGGMEAALRKKYPVETGIEQPVDAGPYPATQWNLPTYNIDQVAGFVQDKDHLVIDVRDAYRYRGEREPIDMVAGHIPGAVNVPFSTNLTPDGTFLSPEELRFKYESVIGNRKPENIIVHCGSGVTACHTLLALEQAGINGAGLYVGSWSEWSRTGREIAREPAT